MNGDFQFDVNRANEYAGFDQVEPSKTKGRKFSIAALVLGIVSVAGCCLCCCIPYLSLLVMFVCGILAIIFAILSKKETENKKMSGMAIAGLILGIVGMLIALVSLVILVAGLATLGSMTEEERLIFFEEMFKPLMSEEEYQQFLDAIESAYGAEFETVPETTLG